MKINVNIFSPESIDEAIRKTEERRDWIDKKTKELITRLHDSGIEVAKVLYSNATYAGYLRVVDFDMYSEFESTDLIGIKPDVELETTGTGYRAKIRATGGLVLFVEFGTGIHFANSYQAEHGYAPGQYGRGKGRRPGYWFYQGPVGDNPPEGTEPVRTRRGRRVVHTNSVFTIGNPPNRVMMHTKEYLEATIRSVAKEVFRD